MAMRRAGTAEEYADRVKPAVLEVQDLRGRPELEVEGLQHFPAFPDQRQEGLNEVCESMKPGTCAFGCEAPPFMDVGHANADEIPFYTLLRRINETRRKGLEVEQQEH